MIVAIVIVLTTLVVLVGLFLLQFYRDPERTIPQGNNIVSPADGTVIKILRIDKKTAEIEKGLLGKIRVLTKDISDSCYLVSIFMSPLDVHVNRAPITGTVRKIKYSKGTFFNARDFERSLENEHNEILIENKKIGKIKTIQISGFLARRIRCNLKENQHVDKGARIGKILLGSQATLIMPVKNITILVQEGQKVLAGSSLIATVKK